MANKKIIPAISVIIPMYNVEKYIGECLDSIFAQTFDDYEIIVVDDCSTDKGCEVVENYIPKFNGRLQLIKSEKNSGGAGVPRNIGIRFSRGKYIFLMDSDDTMTPTALEELYNVAEKFQADVVHSGKFFKSPGETAMTDKKFLTAVSIWREIPVTQPEPLFKNLPELVEKFTSYKIWAAPWSFLFRRDLIVTNNLTFPKIGIGDDVIFVFETLICAKNIINVPNYYYVFRERLNSNTRQKLDAEKSIHRHGASVMKGVTLLSNFMDKYEFFQKQPEYKFAVLEFFASDHLQRVIPVYFQNSTAALDKFIRKELEQVEDKTALTAFLFSRMNVLNANLIQQNQIIQQQQKKIQELQAQLNQK